MCRLKKKFSVCNLGNTLQCMKEKSLPSFQNVLVLMHPSNIKALKCVKNSVVLLNYEKGPMLLRCWPCVSVPLSSVVIPSQDFYWDYLPETVTLECYNQPIVCAGRIILAFDKYEPFMECKAFKKFLQTKLDALYLREGLVLNFVYLGHKCYFTVKKLISSTGSENVNYTTIESICESISSLNVSDNLISEESVDDISFSCSTPKYSKISKLHLLPENMKCIESKIITDESKQFYSVHLSTEILFENMKRESVLLNQISFQDLGGLNEQINDMKSLINSFLAQDSEMKKNHSGIILIGPCGTGKSILVQALGNEFHLPVFSLNKCKFSRDKEELKLQLQNLFKKSVENSPSILFLDNIDTFCKDYGTSNLQSGFSAAHLLSTMLYDILNSDYQTVVISATNSIFDVDVSLRKPGLLEKEIYFGTPSDDDRKEILNKILRRLPHTLSQEEISEISVMTHGFTGGDIRLLCDKAIISAQQKACDIVAFLLAFEDVKEAIKNVKPSSVAEFKFEVPNIKWSDIGGMQEVKIAITEMVYWPIKHSEQFKKLKIEPARGILMYGPPGCSKTMIAKALASESQLNFIPVKGTELYNKYVGESEKALSEIFKKARSASPCILFFDEIDSIAPIRGSLTGNSNVTDRILNQLLVEIDGIDVLQSQVHIVAATNLPGNIDKSLLRPGRFNKVIYVPLPDARTRKEIFEAKLENKPVAKDVNITFLVDSSKGYTGAEISDICLEAAVFAMKDNINTLELANSVLTMNNFMSALDSVKPRTSEEMLKSYEEFKFDVKRM